MADRFWMMNPLGGGLCVLGGEGLLGPFGLTVEVVDGADVLGADDRADDRADGDGDDEEREPAEDGGLSVRALHSANTGGEVAWGMMTTP